MRFLLFILCVTIVIPTGVALAQFSGDLTSEEIAIDLEPRYPSPGDTVTATINDYSLGAGGGTIRWSVNGTAIADSDNERSISFVAGSLGVPQNISAKISYSNGLQREAKQRITPVYTDVIIEPQTYSPASYNGRSLPTGGSTVYLTALVHTDSGVIDPAEHMYSWTVNNKSLNGGQIRGGYKTKFTIPSGREVAVAVSIYDMNRNLISRKLIAVPSVEVDVQFYEVSTLFGLSERAVSGTLPLVGNSTTIRAVPYNLDRAAVQGNLFTEWRVNNQVRSSAGDPFELTLLRQGAQISSRVSFKVRNLSALIQSDEASFTLQY